MKKIWLFVCLFGFISILGCSKEDSIAEDMTDLVGVWGVDQIFLTEGSATFEVADTTYIGDFSLEAKDITTVLTLNEDRSMSSDGNYLAQTKYTLFDQTTEAEFLASDFGGRGIWNRDGRQIIIEQDSSFHALNIRTFENDTLELFFPLDLEYQQDNITSIFKGTLNYILVK